MAEYSVTLTTLGGTNLAFLTNVFDLKITRRLNSYCSATFHVKTLDDNAGLITVGSRAVKIYRNQVLIFHGRVWEPVRWNSEQIQVEARDPWAVVQNRRVRALTRYDQVDAAAIASDLINLQNAEFTTRLTLGDAPASVLRDRTYDPGKLVGEAVEQLAEVQDGFWFKIDPDLEAAPGQQAKINFLYPDSGALRETVHFEYGDDTLRTLSDFEVQKLLPRNRITARGALVGGSDGLQLTQTASSSSSIGEFDLYEDEVSYSDVSEQETIDSHAIEEVRSQPITTYTLTPAPDSPRLWDDFDVGDIVNFKLKHGAVNEEGFGRVTAATMVAGDDGAETLENLVLELEDPLSDVDPLPPPPPPVPDPNWLTDLIRPTLIYGFRTHNDATSFTAPSFTYKAGRLYMMFLYCYDAGGGSTPPNPTPGPTVSWTNQFTEAPGGLVRRSWWTAAPVADVTEATVLNFGSNVTTINWTIIEIAGGFHSTPIGSTVYAPTSGNAIAGTIDVGTLVNAESIPVFAVWKQSQGILNITSNAPAGTPVKVFEFTDIGSSWAVGYGPPGGDILSFDWGGQANGHSWMVAEVKSV